MGTEVLVVFILQTHVSYVYYSAKLDCYVLLDTQVEMGRALTFRASSRGH